MIILLPKGVVTAPCPCHECHALTQIDAVEDALAEWRVALIARQALRTDEDVLAARIRHDRELQRLENQLLGH